ncbi:Uncharacterized RWD, RING finger and WD repeat-containing protein C11E3.05 [Serendipita indica DSM 11827]|nr:Uncharacterized RWD, RING finger and WD repeat-containing protein C11E3.05 [Serendipita indica DSM 11827]
MALHNPLPPRDPALDSKNAANILHDGPEANTTFRSSLRIDMKQLVSVGKMSISPSSREIALASRAGLYIIDLDNPLNVPAFLPQGGMWEIADVQWNPHPSWSQYILSTLVWNLESTSKTHIERTLQSHFRAITDINWHYSIPSRVATCAIDSWVWLWDLRTAAPTTKMKPTMGLSAFNESATQVKWNHKDPHVLATSHDKDVLIWDDRKGSMPVNIIRAHDSTIYGINWSRIERNEITTCSLDKSIKTWDAFADPSNEPIRTIRTDYPVWRARNLPFGRGILAQPHRGRLMLDMYSADQLDAPVHQFGGFTDVVTESVWRIRGGYNANYGKEFQLITWDRSAVLRFFPVDTSILQRPRHYRTNAPKRRTEKRARTALKDEIAHLPSTPPGTADTLTIGSTSPVNHFIKPPNYSGGFSASVSTVGSANTKVAETPVQTTPGGGVAALAPIVTGASGKGASAGGPMTMGKGHGRAARPQVDPLTWYSVVEEEDRKRSTSVGSAGARRRSASQRRTDSGSASTRRNETRARSVGHIQDSELETQDEPQTLKDEITQAASKFSSSKLKIVEINLTAGSRKCNIEMHRPTGLFLRVLFSFPDAYPGSVRPTIDIDPNRKITPRKRAVVLRELRKICAQNTLCIEPCIRFLLGLPSHSGGVGGIGVQKPFSLESDSEEEDVQVDEVPDMETGGAPKIQQNQPPRERTAHAVFSMNGMLVRIVTNDSARPKPGASPTTNLSAPEKTSHLGDLPRALRGLAKLAKQLPVVADNDPNAAESTYDFADVFSTQPGVRHTSTNILGPMWNNQGQPFKARSKDRVTVLIQPFPNPDPDEFDPVLAGKFSYTTKDPPSFASPTLWRLHHMGEMTTGTLSGGAAREDGPVERGIQKIYHNLVQRRNLQMLAMFSIANLLAEQVMETESQKEAAMTNSTPAHSESHTYALSSTLDYFSLRPRSEAPRPPSPATTRSPSPETTAAPAVTPPPNNSLGTIASKAGAISSVLLPLFFTGTSEGSDYSHKSRGSDPPTPVSSDVPGSIPEEERKSDASLPVNLGSGSGGASGGSGGTGSLGRLAVGAKPKRAASTFVPTPGTVQKTTITFALVGTPKRHVTSAIPQDRWRREGKIPVPIARPYLLPPQPGQRKGLSDAARTRYIFHIRFYAELLFRAGLLEARNEVLIITNRAPLEILAADRLCARDVRPRYRAKKMSRPGVPIVRGAVADKQPRSSFQTAHSVAFQSEAYLGLACAAAT